MSTTTQADPHSHPPQRFEPAIAKKHVNLAQVPSARQLRIMQVFFHADMRLGHEGLKVQAKQFGIDVLKLVPGQFVVFVNSAEDKIKVYASNNIVAYMQLPAGRKVDPRIIREIPRAFNSSGKLDYDEMLANVVQEHFAKRAVARKGIAYAKEEEESDERSAEA